MHNEHREEPGVPVRRWTVTERQLAGVGPAALLVHAAGVRQVAAAAPPQSHGAMGAVHTAEREARRVRGEVGVDQRAAAGEDGGTAGAGDGPPPASSSISSAARPAALLAVVPALESSVALSGLAAVEEDAV